MFYTLPQEDPKEIPEELLKGDETIFSTYVLNKTLN